MMFHDFSGLLLKKCFKCKCDFSVCLLGLHYSERQTNTLLDLLFLNNGLTHSLRNQPHWKVFLLFFFFFFPLNCELQSKAVLIESSSGVLKKYLDKDSLHHIWKKNCRSAWCFGSSVFYSVHVLWKLDLNYRCSECLKILPCIAKCDF